MLKKTAMTLAISASACYVPLVTHAQGLTGSQVSGGIYCCQAPTGELRTNLVTETVSSAIEFPNGVFMPTSSLTPIPVTIDVTSNTIDISYSRRSVAAGGAFDGYILDFAGAPEITGVSLDPLSTVTPVSLTSDANTVFVNVTGQLLPADSRMLINVLAVPEPQSVAMLLGGIGILGFYGRRRRNNMG